MPNWLVEAVLFDMDGTLVDSSGSVERSWRRLAKLIPRPFPEVEPYIHGIPVPQVMATLEPDMPANRVAELAAFMVEAESTDTEGVVALPGALEALRDLPPDRIAIVTSCGTRLSTARIAASGLPAPAVVITADDVQTGKPDPAPFLLAARRLGFPPERCLVVEDSPAGVASARSAGCVVIGVLTTYPELDAPSVPAFVDIEFTQVDGGIRVTIAAAAPPKGGAD